MSVCLYLCVCMCWFLQQGCQLWPGGLQASPKCGQIWPDLRKKEAVFTAAEGGGRRAERVRTEESRGQKLPSVVQVGN